MRKIRSWLAAPLALLVVAGVGVSASPAHADAAGRGGDFVPLAAPAQLLDTRTGIGGATGPRDAGDVTAVQVTGRAGVPATGVSAVLVDLAVVNPSTATVVVAWPDGAARPENSMLNAKAGVIMSNSAVVPVAANGKVDVVSTAGSTHLIMDVHGYFLSTPSSAPGRGGFVPVTHTRLVDTRNGTGAPKAEIAAGGSLTVAVGTGAPVPASAAAAFLNITVIGATKQGWVAAIPAGGSSAVSTFDYPLGTTSEGTAVKLGTGGKVTIVNHGGGPVHLVLDAEGYFSANPAEGAGLRPVLARLVDTRRTDAQVPAGGTLDLAVGGTNGLPTRAIGGAVLNLTAINPATGGYLSAWPTGSAAPATSITNFSAADTRAGTAIVRPGTEGKVTVRNNSGEPLHLLVDLQGWFADPLPGVPVATYTRGAAVQAAPAGGAQLGTLEFAYVDNIGRLVHGRAEPDNLLSVQWTVVSGGEAFTGTPALGQQPDGRVQVAAQHTDSNIWATTQNTAGMPGFGPFARLGGSMAGPPAIGRLPDGTLVQFAVDADGRLWSLAQTGANGGYGSWHSLGDADLVGTPTVVAVDDALEVVGLTTAGSVRMAAYHLGGTLSAWTDLGGTGLTGSPGVVVYPGFRIRVFARDAAGAVVTRTPASAWERVGDLVAAGSPAALLEPVSGRTVVIARRADGTIHAIRETGQGSGAWGNWVEAPAGGFTAATDPTVLTYTNSSGPTYLFVARDADNAQHVWFPNTSP